MIGRMITNYNEASLYSGSKKGNLTQVPFHYALIHKKCIVFGLG